MHHPNKTHQWCKNKNPKTVKKTKKRKSSNTSNSNNTSSPLTNFTNKITIMTNPSNMTTITISIGTRHPIGTDKNNSFMSNHLRNIGNSNTISLMMYSIFRENPSIKLIMIVTR